MVTATSRLNLKCSILLEVHFTSLSTAGKPWRLPSVTTFLFGHCQLSSDSSNLALLPQVSMASTSLASDALGSLFNWVVKGELITEANADGTLAPLTVHYGDHDRDTTLGLYLGAFSAIPPELADYVQLAKDKFREFQGEEPNFNLVTFHVFRPGTTLDWHNSKFAGKTPDQNLWGCVCGDFQMSFALSTRANEGCDRFGNPYDSDEPVPHSRNYDCRKQLWDRYKAKENGISHEVYIRMLRKLFQTHPPNTEPVVRGRHSLLSGNTVVPDFDAVFGKHSEVSCI